MSAPLPETLRLRWWRHDLVRFVVAGALVVGLVGLVVLWQRVPSREWDVDLGGGWQFSPTPKFLLALLMGTTLLVLLPLVSYRRVDALLMLLPVVNVVLMGKWLYRVQLLPRRDWLPRADELPRAVRLPQGRGLLPRPRRR